MLVNHKVVWQSENGAIRSFDAMDDEHLANLLHFVRYYDKTRTFAPSFILQLNEEITKRRLSTEFLEKAPYPYKDKSTGDWYIWSYDVHHNVKVSDLVKKPLKTYAKWILPTGLCFTKNKLYEVIEVEDGCFKIIDDNDKSFTTCWDAPFEKVVQ